VPALEDLVRLRQRLVEAGALVGESNHETHLSLRNAVHLGLAIHG
jgi:hypothetical protein